MKTLLIVPVLFYAGLAALPAPTPVSSTTVPTTTVLPTAEATGKDVFAIDGVHSSLLFKVRHLGVSDFWGRFNGMRGSVVFDPADLAACRLQLTVDADSVDTGNANRDKHLRSPQFFNVKQHRSITFQSTKFAAGASGALRVTGELQLLGESKSISFDAQFLGKKDTGSPRFGTRAGFAARFTIRRSDFGMNYMVKNGVLGDEVEVVVNLEGVLGK